MGGKQLQNRPKAKRAPALESEVLKDVHTSVLLTLLAVIPGFLSPDEISDKTSYSRGDISTACQELAERSQKRGWKTLQVGHGKPRLGAKPGGRLPRQYALASPGMITWPESAFLLMEHNYFQKDKRRPRVLSSEFKAHLFKNCGYFEKVPDGVDLAPVDDIVDYACLQTYLRRDPPDEKHAYHFLIGGVGRFRSEEQYLLSVAHTYPGKLIEATNGEKNVTFSYFLQNHPLA